MDLTQDHSEQLSNNDGLFSVDTNTCMNDRVDTLIPKSIKQELLKIEVNDENTNALN